MTGEPVGMRDRILQEAAALFVARGYSSVAMREIAQACQITKAALYYHFSDKEALFLAILENYLDRVETLIQSCICENLSARELIFEITRAIFRQPVDQRAIIRLGSQEMVNISENARVWFGKLYQEKFTGQISNIFREGIRTGEFRAIDPDLLTWSLLGLMYPFFYPSSDRRQIDSVQTADCLTSILFKGIINE